MTRVLLLVLALAGLDVSRVSAGSFDSGVPLSGRQEFSVFRDGERIGTDVSEFLRDGDRLTVRSHTDIAVEILSIVVYRYEKDSEEQWVDGKLVGLRSDINDDGDKSAVELTGDDATEPKLLHVSTGDKSTTVKAGLMPSSFWNPATVEQSEFIDPEDGQTRRVIVAPHGFELLKVAGRDVKARHYRMSGDIDRDLWYGLDGQLLKIEFEAEDGSRIILLRNSL
jgi:hypothetical protein